MNTGSRPPGESAPAHAAFLRYRDLGPSRSLDEAYRQHRGEKAPARQQQGRMLRAPGTWKRWYTTFGWKERAEDWDAQQERRLADLRQQYERVRLQREYKRRDEAESVANLLVQRVREMLAWPIQEEVTVERTEVTPDGQHLHIHQRVIKPMKWDMNTIVRFVEAFDRISRSSVEDATEGKLEEKAEDTGNIAGTFTLHTPDQIQMPKPPEEAVKAEPTKDVDWIVDAEEGGVPRTPEQTVW
jgi:hypothetical protein